MTDILKRIGDKASEVVNTLKSIPPGESEKKGLEAIQDNVNSYSHATADTKPSVAPEGAPAEQDKVSPLSRYGSRPGEKRIDTRKMLKPLGSSVPSYDEGTDRVPEDQLAMVHKDEAVLPPDEAEKYRAEHAETKPTTETATAQPSTDTLSLKPYGQVMEEKANQKAAEQTAAQSAEGAPKEAEPKKSRMGGSLVEPSKAEVSTEQPAEEKPKLTYGHILAEDWLKHNGLNVDAMKAPKEFNQGTPEPAMGAPNPAGPLKPIVQPENPTNPTAAPTGKEAFRAQIKMYDAAYQSAMDRAAATNDPQYREQAGRIQEAKLAYEKAHPWGSPESAHPGVLGKIGHVAEMVASRAPGLAPIVATLPGSEMSRANEARGAREEVKEASAENTARRTEEAKANPLPVPDKGDQGIYTAPDGTRYQRYEMPDHTMAWAKEGEVPNQTSPLRTPPKGDAAAAAQAAPTIGNQPNLAEHPAVKASLPTGGVFGKPPVPKEGEQPATAAQMADVNTRLQNNPYVPKEVKPALQFPEGYKPTQNDVKERLANIKEIEDAVRQGKQDDAMNALRKLQEQNQALMTQAHLADMQDKHQQAQAKEAVNSSVALAGLYAQQNYKDEMDKWYKSGNFAKDSGLITEIVDKEHSDKGVFSSVVGDSLVGSLFGPEGTAIGAGVGALTGLFAGPANGYLETLKKQGISPEGYDAMQSYFNALPARMAYEISVQGVAASAMRSAQLIQKVLNTVPPPNTPQESFDSNFNRYYKPMEVLTNKKVELSAPKGYVPPKKEDFYPPKAAPQTKGAEVPREGNSKYHMGNAKGEIFSNDGKTWYDAQGKLIKNK